MKLPIRHHYAFYGSTWEAGDINHRLPVAGVKEAHANTIMAMCLKELYDLGDKAPLEKDKSKDMIKNILGNNDSTMTNSEKMTKLFCCFYDRLGLFYKTSQIKCSFEPLSQSSFSFDDLLNIACFMPDTLRGKHDTLPNYMCLYDSRDLLHLDADKITKFKKVTDKDIDIMEKKIQPVKNKELLIHSIFSLVMKNKNKALKALFQPKKVLTLMKKVSSQQYFIKQVCDKYGHEMVRIKSPATGKLKLFNVLSFSEIKGREVSSLVKTWFSGVDEAKKIATDRHGKTDINQILCISA